ncbi:MULTISPECIES: precorrin-3B C(17)-methyltransferase [Prochlorococcus]|uniref:precorrin-3B C(17)-methyltransferase n=1 Tax=Prochlorococcus TaxID=1218 RepID=UPI0007B36115|nr:MULTISPECIES: precorrin-3B C(17)-methyltransferase [Prochlorococcus]KZR63659.1 Cobalt-precorrin-3B C(17)-methyltransferase [Prochlorococcus marinus str. MIT 1312]KZR78813.1 Cobalt-precorrin-3B C(17)-methyltransferase [Prochlorococcus marinus str. MIT 1327]NMO84489.1 precorrin-3B C(17)-methyltransferase [Prochlorococcus sp. P1344]NMP06203.1 precorrin-3B C(17)-methyltransferase [Prochlorococcus sp. P1361]NMP14160.1 precorrin-3B C(17)-methyltransferase [Prochlorococcus sp.P1363]
MQRLARRHQVDQLALTPRAANTLEETPQSLVVGPASEVLSRNWQPNGVLLIVGAIGAVTRLIAPLLIEKDKDPAVIVLDAHGKHVVPLLGGHQAGAEQLAMELAAELGGHAVLTGDSNSQNRLALDSFGKGWGWRRSGSRDNWNQLMLTQAQGGKLLLLQHSGATFWQTTAAAQDVFDANANGDQARPGQLTIGPQSSMSCSWHPASLWIGIGCERDTSLSLLERAVTAALAEAGLAPEAVAGLASIDRKDDETALLALAQAKDWPVRFFNADALSEVDVPTPSAVVAKAMGTSSVAEAAALLAASNKGTLLLTKQIHHAQNAEHGATTIAISEANHPFAPQRGELHLIGSGPGDLAFLTHDARAALARSAIWVGYDLYLDLLEPLRRPDQARLDGQLTRERDRCLKALELAQQGARVALISSGDSGIYGMAGLALELWLTQPPSDRPQFQVHPGLSALQLAAAKVGAPLMHDFCSVSLSDRLTPWSKIETRLKSAARGDFVVALYNPRSQERDWQLTRAIELLLEHRAPSTPVVVARQLGRAQENIQLHTLQTLPVKEVDMLTIVLIGNSSSRLQDNHVVTPRGYPGAELA